VKLEIGSSKIVFTIDFVILDPSLISLKDIFCVFKSFGKFCVKKYRTTPDITKKGNAPRLQFNPGSFPSDFVTRIFS